MKYDLFSHDSLNIEKKCVVCVCVCVCVGGGGGGDMPKSNVRTMWRS